MKKYIMIAWDEAEIDKPDLHWGLFETEMSQTINNNIQTVMHILKILLKPFNDNTVLFKQGKPYWLWRWNDKWNDKWNEIYIETDGHAYIKIAELNDDEDALLWFKLNK